MFEDASIHEGIKVAAWAVIVDGKQILLVIASGGARIFAHYFTLSSTIHALVR